jgi:UbiD family decarboxylase
MNSGAHPLVYVGSQSRVGMEVDEYSIVGGLFGAPLELVHGRTVDVEVPAQAEIVFEGRILAGVHEPEGPFGEYTGYSNATGSTQNVLEVTAVRRRHDAIYLDLIPGNSSDHLTLMKVSKRPHLLARLREAVPQIRDINIANSGVSYHCYLSLHKTAEGQARQALMCLFGLDYEFKLAIAVDADIDINDSDDVLWAVATRMQPDQRVFIVPEVFCCPLGPSSCGGVSAKMGIDATAPLDSHAVRCEVSPEGKAHAAEILGRRGK